MHKFISLNNSRDNIPHPCVVHWLQPMSMWLKQVSSFLLT